MVMKLEKHMNMIFGLSGIEMMVAIGFINKELMEQIFLFQYHQLILLVELYRGLHPTDCPLKFI
jgi:hypothetical protein